MWFESPRRRIEPLFLWLPHILAGWILSKQPLPLTRVPSDTLRYAHAFPEMYFTFRAGVPPSSCDWHLLVRRVCALCQCSSTSWTPTRSRYAEARVPSARYHTRRRRLLWKLPSAPKPIVITTDAVLAARAQPALRVHAKPRFAEVHHRRLLQLY